jgi:hypothetical protein
MRIIIYLLLLLFLGCAQQEQEYSYIKIFKSSPTDSVNSYNKGLGLSSFVFYSPKNDSFFYSSLSGSNKTQFETYTAQTKSTDYPVIFNSIVYSFKTKPNGIIQDKIPSGSTYCGPEYYLEFVNKGKTYYFVFILDGDPSFKLVDSLFTHMNERSTFKKVSENSYFNPDTEVVNAAKKLGVYDNMEVPYIPKKCSKEINYTNLIGDWRIINEYHRSRGSYRKISITSIGQYIAERIIDNKSEKKDVHKYYLNKQKNELRVFLENKKTEDYKIETISDSCLQLILLKYKTTITLNRL